MDQATLDRMTPMELTARIVALRPQKKSGKASPDETSMRRQLADLLGSKEAKELIEKERGTAGSPLS